MAWRQTRVLVWVTLEVYGRAYFSQIPFPLNLLFPKPFPLLSRGCFCFQDVPLPLCCHDHRIRNRGWERVTSLFVWKTTGIKKIMTELLKSIVITSFADSPLRVWMCAFICQSLNAIPGSREDFIIFSGGFYVKKGLNSSTAPGRSSYFHRMTRSPSGCGFMLTFKQPGSLWPCWHWWRSHCK